MLEPTTHREMTAAGSPYDIDAKLPLGPLEEGRQRGWEERQW